MYIAENIKNIENISKLTAEKLQRKANSVARKSGYGRADCVIFGDCDCVINHIEYGYRKITTGEYVPRSYLNNFGWKNTYYQKAFTTVKIKMSV